MSSFTRLPQAGDVYKSTSPESSWGMTLFRFFQYNEHTFFWDVICFDGRRLHLTNSSIGAMINKKGLELMIGFDDE